MVPAFLLQARERRGGRKMSLFFPDYSFRRVYEIPSRFFLEQGVRVLLLDVDNTLTTHDNPTPHREVLAWLDAQREAGLRLFLLSNNTPERVAPFAQKIGLEFIARAKKPLPFPLWRTLKGMGIPPRQAAIIGDQIFTDVLCGRLSRCLSVLVEPMEEEDWGFLATKRRWEKQVLRRYPPRQWQPNPQMEGWELAFCGECGSCFRKGSSQMAGLCPECAHYLYGYPGCGHLFENGRCVRCGWDGSESPYIRKLKR